MFEILKRVQDDKFRCHPGKQSASRIYLFRRFWTSQIDTSSQIEGKIWIHPLFYMAIAATIFIVLSGVIYYSVAGSGAKKSNKPPVEGDLIAENDSYSIYLVKAKESGPVPTTITVYDKSKKKQLATDIYYSKIGTPVIFNDSIGSFLLLSTGQYTTGAINPRVATVINLTSSTRAVTDFCHAGNPYFWNDFVIYDSCDRFINRPWGHGEAPSISVKNLKTDKEQIVFQATTTSHYRVLGVSDSTLESEEYYVAGESDWRKTEPKKRRATYNLLRLN